MFSRKAVVRLEYTLLLYHTEYFSVTYQSSRVPFDIQYQGRYHKVLHNKLILIILNIMKWFMILTSWIYNIIRTVRRALYTCKYINIKYDPYYSICRLRVMGYCVLSLSLYFPNLWVSAQSFYGIVSHYSL